MTAPAYALITPSLRHSASELSQWLTETPGFKQGLKMSKEDMIVQLNLAKQDYWNKAHRKANAAPPSRARNAAATPATKAAFCAIAAAEINAWLATLPPVPNALEDHH